MYFLQLLQWVLPCCCFLQSWYKVFIKLHLFQFYLCLIFSFRPFVYYLILGVFLLLWLSCFCWNWVSFLLLCQKWCLAVISPVKINPSLGQPAEKIAFPSHGFVVLWQQLPEFSGTAQAAVKGTLLPIVPLCYFTVVMKPQTIFPVIKWPLKSVAIVYEVSH